MTITTESYIEKCNNKENEKRNMELSIFPKIIDGLQQKENIEKASQNTRIQKS